MFKNINKKQGVSVYMAIMLMAIMLTIAFGLGSILVVQIKTIRNIGYSVVAYYAAETGIEQALNDTNCDANCLYNNVELILSSGERAYYSIRGYSPGTGSCPAGTEFCVNSVGTYKQIKRAIQIMK